MEDFPFEDLLAIFTEACSGHSTVRGPPAPRRLPARVLVEGRLRFRLVEELLRVEVRRVEESPTDVVEKKRRRVAA